MLVIGFGWLEICFSSVFIEALNSYTNSIATLKTKSYISITLL